MSVQMRRMTAVAIALGIAALALLVAFAPGFRHGALPPLHPTGGFSANGEVPSGGITALEGPRYGSWSGSDAHTGHLVSDTFTAGFAVSMAVSGYPSVPGERVIIERTDASGMLPITLPKDPGESWERITVPLPLAWYGKPVRVTAADDSTAKHGWIGVADVRPASIKAALASDVRFHLLGDLAWPVSFVLALLYAALWLRDALRLPRVLLFATFLLAAGVAAEATFFLTLLSTALATVVVIIAALYGAGGTVFALRDTSLRAEIAQVDSWAPFAAAAIAALAFTGILCVQLTPSGSPIYAVSDWLHEPADNILPYIMAQHTVDRRPPKPFVRERLSSDRPPLQAGFDLALRPLTPFVHDSLTRYVALSIVLQASAIGMIFVLVRTCGCSALRAAGVTSFALFSGFFLENTVFVWPKLIAAAYIVVALAIALAPGALGRRRAVAIGAAIALGMLSHGGVAFTIPALAVGLAAALRRAAVRPLVLAACAALALYAPWSAYQKFYDPPGDRLLKWHLAGHIPPTDEPFTSLLVHAYTGVPASTIVHHKVSNFSAALGGEGISAFAPILREKLAMRYVLGALALPFVAALLWGFINRREPIRRATAIAWLGVGGIVFWCLAMYGPNAGVIPNGSYANVVLLFAAAGIVATEWAALYALVLVAQIYDFAHVWLSTVTPGSFVLGSLTPLIAFAAVAAIAAAAVMLGRRVPLTVYNQLQPAPELRLAWLQSLRTAWRQMLPAASPDALRAAPEAASAEVFVAPAARAADDRMVAIALTAAISAALLAGATAHPGVLSPTTPKLAMAVDPLAPSTPYFSIDLVEIDGRGIPANSPVHARPFTPMHVVGWAVDPSTGAPPSAIEVRSDGGAPRIAPLGIERADVARVLARAGAANSGFTVVVDSGAPGHHVLHFAMLAHGRRIPLPFTIPVETEP